jgi:glycosyltransferase involved in cell wall biosynthesis
MRVAYLSDSIIPSRAANAVQVMTMCETLARAGHALTLFARRGEAPEGDVFRYYGVEPSFELVTCRAQGAGRLGRVLYAAALRREVRARPRPDVAYGRSALGLAAVASLGAPLVYEAHGPVRGWAGHGLHRWLFARPNFRRLVTTTMALKQWFERRFPALAGRVLVAPCGGVGAQRCALPREGGAAAGGWRRRPGALQVGYVGQLYPGKGMEVLVPLARRLRDVDVHVVGGAPGDLARWRRRLNGTPNLILHGHVAPAQTPGFCEAMDVLIAPAQPLVGRAGRQTRVPMMSSPLKLFEYIAAGKPIVASDVPVIREMLTDRVSALLVPPGDLDAWVEAVWELGADAGLRERLAARAREEVGRRFTWERRAAHVLEGIGA